VSIVDQFEADIKRRKKKKNFNSKWLEKNGVIKKGMAHIQKKGTGG
jgi:hypothetical protein